MTEPFIHTSSGGKFIYGSRDTEVRLEDIAKHLSQVNRFCGASRYPYSVAQHSVVVVLILRKVFGVTDPNTLKRGLLHDAHEYVINDQPTPFQEWFRDDICGGVDFLEIAKERLDRIILTKMGLQWPAPEAEAAIVKLADKAAFVIEAAKLFDEVPLWLDTYKRRYNFPANLDKIDIPLTPMIPSLAEERFLKLYRELQDEIDKETDYREIA
jgi:hypothetical protein